MRAADDGSVLHVRVRPGASRTGIAGIHGEAVAIRVGAKPVDGAANRELLAVLSHALRVAVSSLALEAGARGRDKRVMIRGLAPEAVRARLGPLLRV